MLRKSLCTCLMSIVPTQKQNYKHKCIHAQTTQMCWNLQTKKVSSVENNRSPIFCVCELLVSNIEEALSRSQCLRATMQQNRLCNNATVRQLFNILHPHTPHTHSAPPTRKLLSHKLGSVTPLWMIVNMRLPTLSFFEDKSDWEVTIC